MINQLNPVAEFDGSKIIGGSVKLNFEIEGSDQLDFNQNKND